MITDHGQPWIARAFWLHDHPSFGPELGLVQSDASLCIYVWHGKKIDGLGIWNQSDVFGLFLAIVLLHC
jgi:hypothetical protein